MTPEEMKELGERVANGKATPEEKLIFLKQLNQMVEGMAADIKSAKS